jgi:hypothetical protein
MQYLVPLNKDEAFKKVFSNKHIAKAFLEDMLNVTIQEIELLGTDHKITNAASIVRFDFRCKINNEDVIIEIQNDYYEGLIKRFYLYHCLSTSLQLEVIKDKIEEHPITGSKKLIKRYAELRPVTSIVWWAESCLGIKEDFIEFNTYPKRLADFILDDSVWIQEKEEILAMRNELLALLKKETHGFEFHAQNRLIYVFQKNVVRNKRNERYFKWFEFAQKTLDKNNKASDFQPFINNAIFSEMIQRLSTEFMPAAELRQMMGDEAYFAALALGEQDKEQNRRDKIYAQFYEEFGEQVEAEKSAARWELTMAYQKFGVEKRTLLAEKVKLEQEKKEEREKLEREKKEEREKLEREKKEEREKAKQLLKFEKEKAKKEQGLLLKVEKEKAKNERIALLKTQKEKQEQLLKAEKEKQKQLLKAAKEKQEQLLKTKEKEERIARMKIVRKMLDKGNSVETIADLLDATILQVHEWIKLDK